MLHIPLLLSVLHTVGCLNVRQWRPDGGTLQHLAQSPDTGDLYVGAINSIYQLDANLNLTHQVNTRWNATTDDLSTMVIVNKTLTGTYQITTCGTSRDACQINRNSSDISSVIANFTPAVHTSGSRAFSVPFTGGTDMFIACPHSAVERHGMACESPGIIWRTQTSDGSIAEHDIHFISEAHTPVTTSHFVAAFPVRQYRLFFSVQTRALTTRPNFHKDSTSWSRIAQICQVNNLEIWKTVYVDMKIKCSGYNEITVAKYIAIASEQFIVAAFRMAVKRQQSAICVYRLADVERRFVENIQVCYNGSHARPTEDYIGTASMCRKANLDLSKVTDPVFFSCNTGGLHHYNRVIGTKALDSSPRVEYNDTEITGLALLVKASEILAFRWN